MTPDTVVVPRYPGGMRPLKWLYRLPGRINRSFGPTVAATNVESSVGMGGVGVNAAAVIIVAEEIKSTGSDKVDDQADNPTD